MKSPNSQTAYITIPFPEFKLNCLTVCSHSVLLGRHVVLIPKASLAFCSVEGCVTFGHWALPSFRPTVNETTWRVDYKAQVKSVVSSSMNSKCSRLSRCWQLVSFISIQFLCCFININQPPPWIAFTWLFKCFNSWNVLSQILHW